MVAVLHGAGRLIARRALNWIWTGHPGRHHTLETTCRRGLHVPIYDKNLDDQVRPATIPDDVIDLQSNNYWAPDTKTGVFRPADCGGGDNCSLQGNGHGGGSLLLNQTVWFRAAEGVDEPP